jgi:hypothetical protein
MIRYDTMSECHCLTKESDCSMCCVSDLTSRELSNAHLKFFPFCELPAVSEGGGRGGEGWESALAVSR